MKNDLFVTAGEVAQDLGVSKPFAYKLVRQMNEELEEKGFIIRTRSPQNAKRVLLYTTEKGKAFSYAHKRFDALNVSISMQRLLQSCSMEEVDAFYKVMDAYCDLFLKYGVEGIIPED